MAKGVEFFSTSAAENQAEAMKLMGRFFDVASPTGIFGEPVRAGDYTVIPAGEMTVGLGWGLGGGGGQSSSEGTAVGPAVGPAMDGSPDAEPHAATPAKNDVGGGMGGGGGGAAAGRPVAAIIIGPNGVQVEPIFDATKVAIAFFTALGAIFMARRAMRKAARRRA